MINREQAEELIGATRYYTWDELCRTITTLYDRLDRIREIAERDLYEQDIPQEKILKLCRGESA